MSDTDSDTVTVKKGKKKKKSRSPLDMPSFLLSFKSWASLGVIGTYYIQVTVITNITIMLLRAGWMRFGKTRSFFTEFAYPHSDLSVSES